MAVQQGHHQMAVLLLEAEAGSKLQLPPLHVATRKDDAKAVALLLRNGHDANQVTKVSSRPASYSTCITICRIYTINTKYCGYNANFPSVIM